MTGGLATDSGLLEPSIARRHADELAFVEIAAGGGEGAIHGAAVRDLGSIVAEPWIPLDDRRIVVYTRRADELPTATRAWVALAHRGVRVSVLHGGLEGWLDSSGAALAGPPRAVSREVRAPGGFAARPELLPTSRLEETAAYGTLLDARPRDAFEGISGEPRTGHVPGAVSAPARQLLDADQRLLPAHEIRRWLLAHRAIGAQTVGAYCGSGAASSLVVFAAHLIGQPIALHEGRWSDYVDDDANPIEQGRASVRSSAAEIECLEEAEA